MESYTVPPGRVQLLDNSNHMDRRFPLHPVGPLLHLSPNKISRNRNRSLRLRHPRQGLKNMPVMQELGQHRNGIKYMKTRGLELMHITAFRI